MEKEFSHWFNSKKKIAYKESFRQSGEQEEFVKRL
jgi:hypothetical protein